MDNLSSYERQRLKNIEENKKVLASLGLLNGPRVLPQLPSREKQEKKRQGVKRKRAPVKPEQCREDTVNGAILLTGGDYAGYMTRRQSRRLLGKDAGDFSGLDVEIDEEYDDRPRKATPRFKENVFGAIPDIPVGTSWLTRVDCSHDGVHRPTVAGIHGNEAEGCYSLALSGGYEDDLDYGEFFTYTGEGGRDLKGTKANPKNLRTAPQSKDQTLTRGNLALSKNVENGRPVRVIRGYKLRGSLAPDEGYRYDGLYTVERFWQTIGLSGFLVYKFALSRCPNQAPPPWEEEEAEEAERDRSEESDSGSGSGETSNKEDCCQNDKNGKEGKSVHENETFFIEKKTDEEKREEKTVNSSEETDLNANDATHVNDQEKAANKTN